MTRERRRRWFLRSAALAGIGGLAGCSGNSNGDASNTTTAPSETEPTTSARTPGSTPEETVTVDPSDDPAAVADPRQATDRWLASTRNYDGSFESEVDAQRVVINVGAPTSSQPTFGYYPPAVEIIIGTRVQWQWSGTGEPHTVTGRAGVLDSGEPASGSGNTYSHVFDEPGLYRYFCENHGDALGMRGAVLVREQRTLSGYPQVDSWLESVERFEGRLSDRRGQESIEVTVGAPGNDGNFAFRPVAPLVSPGTEVVFRWSGRGGGHNVVWQTLPEGASLPDSNVSAAYNHTFSVSLDEPGVYLYSCGYHGPSGGRGAIVVA
ncbi:MAG: halocyanin domain-containing protein [Halorientalis sp.]